MTIKILNRILLAFLSSFTLVFLMGYWEESGFLAWKSLEVIPDQYGGHFEYVYSWRKLILLVSIFFLFFDFLLKKTKLFICPFLIWTFLYAFLSFAIFYALCPTSGCFDSGWLVMFLIFFFTAITLLITIRKYFFKHKTKNAFLIFLLLGFCLITTEICLFFLFF